MGKIEIYNALVNRHSGIRERYHAFHDNATGVKKGLSWFYLLSLNFRYYMLGQKNLAQSVKMPFYETKEIPCEASESALATTKIGTVDGWVSELSEYEQITFDIFDTLIFRPFSEPTDLFYFLGAEFEIMNFKQLRMEMEYKARLKAKEERGTLEVTLAEIWQMFEREIGIPAKKGIEAELRLEKKFCYANPFMLDVWQRLIELGKQPIVVSDMYLPSDFLRELLDENGFSGFADLFVSCEAGASKADGKIFQRLRADFSAATHVSGKQASGNKIYSWIHVGDNPYSDGKMAQKAGAITKLYPNADQAGKCYRAYDMSVVIGGAYRGIVNHSLYSGRHLRSMEYEYGFVYGGLFAVGYCHFIHEYCSLHDVDRILFLSRDGDILKQVYDRLYSGEDTNYVYWSRLAGMKLMAGFDKQDYFRRFIDHKVNQGKTIRQILTEMDLITWNNISGVSLDDLLTDKNADKLKLFLLNHFDQVLTTYQDEMSAAKKYYIEQLSGCNRAVVVDIGWAGSGAMAISYLAEHVWKIPCEIIGLIAGTNTAHNTEPDASEMFLLAGKLVSYLYSQTDNRDVWKKHDPAKGYNVFWELLLSSPTRQFCGFRSESQETKVPLAHGESNVTTLEQSNVEGVSLLFGLMDSNKEGMREIQQGILDFTDLWMKHFPDFPYMLRISGRDAYAPLLAAGGKDEKYLNTIRQKFSLNEDIS